MGNINMQSGVAFGTNGLQLKKLNIQRGCAKHGAMLWFRFYVNMVQSKLQHRSVKSMTSQHDNRAQSWGNSHVREYKQIITLLEPVSALPSSKKLQSSWTIPAAVSSEPSIPCLPITSKILSTQVQGETGESAEMRIGVPWDLMEFVSQAKEWDTQNSS